MKLYYYVFSLSFLLPFYFTVSNQSSAFTEYQPADSIINIRIAVTGDLMCHSVQFNYSKVGKDTFDFNPVYKYVKKYLIQPDFTLGNFETVLAGPDENYTGFPLFNSPDDYLNALGNTGFDLLTTANNHSLDRKEKGIIRTIEQINLLGLNYTGTFKSAKDRDSIRIYDIKGIKIAFLAYSYGTNGNPVPVGKNYLINLIDTSLIRKDIIKAKDLNAELIVINYHFGEEYQRSASLFQKMLVKKTVEYGADIIIGGHPHVIEPADSFVTVNKKINKGYVIYSMGNFFSNQRDRYKDAGVILNLDIKKNTSTKEITINESYIPTWVFRGIADNKLSYYILTQDQLQDTTIDFLNASDRFKFRQAIEDTKSILKIN